METSPDGLHPPAPPSKWRRLSEKEKAELTSYLLNPLNFGHGPEVTGSKACLYTPGAQIRFGRSVRSLHLEFCFQCGEILIFNNGKEGREGYGLDFAPTGGALCSIFSSFFPNKPEFMAAAGSFHAGTPDEDLRRSELAIDMAWGRRKLVKGRP